MSDASIICPHDAIQLEPSAYAKTAGYNWPALDRRLAATTNSGRNPLAARGKSPDVLEKLTQDAANALSDVFPGPLVLPEDELACNPKYPPQSFRSWNHEDLRKNRKPNKKRKTLYVAAAPEIEAATGFMREWVHPRVGRGKGKGKGKGGKIPSNQELEPPDVDDIIKYTGAFYHGMLVKRFPQRLRFVPWTEPKKSATRSESESGDTKFVGLAVGNNCTRVRVRPSPDGMFGGQLNLSDLLDVAIEMVPEDAYSIVLLVDHDMYEDEEDDFCCGRAYGADRVAVVSTARYHPALDGHAEIDLAHMWPASHCKAYVDDICAAEGVLRGLVTGKAVKTSSGPIWAALQAARSVERPLTLETRRLLWFSRLARTVVHELGHCLGLDHCVYYACVMQGTSRMAEDVRQPPYLCLVCLSKISHAVAYELQARGEAGKEEYVKERYRALVAICEEWREIGLFAGYIAWLRARLERLES
ncbi:hypothetical protein GGS26DRAFT_579086 [Hypomontagnella submonticulosa]|nr:hypothetical protein GGS26DRAFT_579086 [Hypomontagnella submonticulosa]